ncbi:MAG TPA: glucose 1-dehydrogenase [Candidatus Limnocylindria bacterium]|nr:glucose 1-dehydrogenase [Candidatus Limnocylindria bacterium]
MRLEGKVAIITGAGSGMGRTAALLFAREGASIVVADVSERAGEETTELVRAAGGRATFVRTDVAHADDCKSMVQAAVGAYGRLDCLYNNAGIFPEDDHSVLDTDPAVWDRVLAVNVKGVYLGCKYGIAAMLDSGGGSVVNTASFVALVGCSVPQDAYTASKGAVIALTKSLAVQFGPRGVRSNAICPGPIETPLLTAWLLSDPAAKAVRLARNPSGRFGRPEDIAYLALYLASDEAAWTNGAVMVVDGGITSNYF